ncbi:MAG: Cache 3/Cache 2 fusion domain-containing protein [Rhizomicrobium sp.]
MKALSGFSVCLTSAQRSTVAILGRRAVLMVLAVFLLLPLMAGPTFAAGDSKVKDSMQALQAATAALGKPKLVGDDLYFGTTKINGDFPVVDAIKTSHGGTATLFAKKDANFVRVSTNVMKEGQRAIGSVLDPAGPAYAAIKLGNAFYGTVNILGKPYDTGYEPIKTESGDIVGIYYVGYPIE